MKIKYFFYTFLIFTFLSSCNKEKHKRVMENETKENKDSVNLELKIRAELGEGALWNHKTSLLYWVDILKKELHIYNPFNKEDKIIKMPSMIGTVVPYTTSEVIVALEKGIYSVDLESKDVKPFTMIDLQDKNVVFNDGKCDPAGRLWVGTKDNELSNPNANLYMVYPNGKGEVKLNDVTISNGLVWNKAKDKMFYIDTPTQQIVAFDYKNETGEIMNKKTITKIPIEEGSPDGMTIDENDNLWVCLWNGNAVVNIDSSTGEWIQKVNIPAQHVTSCAFGGKNLDILYITTASVDMSEEEKMTYPLAGSLFKIRPGVKGVPSNHFGKD